MTQMVHITIILCNHCNKNWVCVLTLIVKNVYVIWSIPMSNDKYLCIIVIMFVNNKKERKSSTRHRIAKQSEIKTHNVWHIHACMYSTLYTYIKSQFDFQLFACLRRLLHRRSFTSSSSFFAKKALSILFFCSIHLSHYEFIACSHWFVVPLNK